MVKPQKTTNKLHPFPRTGNVARSRFFTIVVGLLAVVGIVSILTALPMANLVNLLNLMVHQMVGSSQDKEIIYPPKVRSSPATGPLRVNPANPRYLTDASGRAILLVGSNYWNLCKMVGAPIHLQLLISMRSSGLPWSMGTTI